MKLRTLIAFLKTLPQDASVSICGMEFFHMYYGRQDGDSFITIDVEELDRSEFTSNGIKGLKIFNSLTVNKQFEVALANDQKLEEAKMIGRVIKKIEDK